MPPIRRTQEHDDDGLHQAGQARDHVVDLGFVEVGSFAQHVVDRARLLANGAHLQHHRWENVGVAHGRGQAGAGGNFLLDFLGRHGVDGVAGRAAHGVQSFNQRDACSKHGGQRARPARDARFVDQFTEDRHFQHESIHEHLQLLVALPCLHEEIKAAADCTEDQPPPLDENLADAPSQTRSGPVGPRRRR